MNQAANFSTLAGMCEKHTFVINHVARDGNAAFGQNTMDDSNCYFSRAFIKKHSIEEGMIVECLTIHNHYTGSQRYVTGWKCVSVLNCGYLEDQIEFVGAHVPEPEPEPEYTVEELIYELFEEHPEDCFTSREVCERVLDTQGVNVEVRDVLRRLHALGDICQLRIKTKASNKRGTILWGLNISSFGFNDVEEAEDEEVEVYES